MALKGKELMLHLNELAAQQHPCSVFIVPDRSEYKSKVIAWERMGNSGQIKLAALEPAEGNLRLVPGDTRIEVIYRYDRRLHNFISLLMRVESNPTAILLRMPPLIQNIQRRIKHRVEPQEEKPVTLELPGEMRAEIPVTRVPIGDDNHFEDVPDPLVADVSRDGIAFYTNYRMDTLPPETVISGATITLPNGKSFECALKLEHVQQLSTGHHRFRAGASITFLTNQSEHLVNNYIERRIREAHTVSTS